MEGRVILKNQDMIAVRLPDASYSVFRLRTDCLVEIGDLFQGPLLSLGQQILFHTNSDTIVEAKVKLAGTHVAAKTKQYVEAEARV